MFYTFLSKRDIKLYLVLNLTHLLSHTIKCKIFGCKWKYKHFLSKEFSANNWVSWNGNVHNNNLKKGFFFINSLFFEMKVFFLFAILNTLPF